jgi:type VI secretion system protein ImpM
MPDPAIALGFYGKIPSRGDFVRARLPAGFIAAWDAWAQASLSASRELLADGWLDAWIEAPVWRFMLPPGACGADAAIGVMLPSVDRANRHFPLVIAACAPSISLLADAGLLDLAESAGCAAVADDLSPDVLTASLDAPVETASLAWPETGARWWTSGGPRVAPQELDLAGLPDAARLAAMLDERVPAT